MTLLLLAFWWPTLGQLPELPEQSPGTRARLAWQAARRGDDGAAVTHLLLLAGRHPNHPLAPWARLGAAFLSERKGDFIAAVVHYRKAEALFPGDPGARVREHREELELELARLPVQAMRQGRALLASAGEKADWERRAARFILRFKPNPLSGRLKLELAARRLLDGRRVSAFALVLWASVDPGQVHRRRAAGILRAWHATDPRWELPVWITLGLLLAWSLVRLWQLGPSGHGLLGGVSAGAALVLLIVPPGFAFFPLWMLLAAGLIWCHGFPRVIGPAAVARIALTGLWITACALILTGRWPW